LIESYRLAVNSESKKKRKYNKKNKIGFFILIREENKKMAGFSNGGHG
jgi:hypothetical protein